MFKNVASQKVAVFAWDGAAGAAKTGDAANITAEISKDGGASIATNDVNPTELDAADHPGVYIFDMTQAETNADLVIITPVSVTADVIFRPIIVYTVAVVNAEVVDALNVDTYAPPGQAAPPATTTLVQMISYLYKAWRNKKDNDGTTRHLYADDEATVDQKSDVSEVLGTVTTEEWESGP